MGNNYSDIDLARYFSGECTPEEKAEIENWYGNSSENKELFDAARFVWERTKNTDTNQYRTEDALSKVHAKLNFETVDSRPSVKINLFVKIGAIAAAILLPALFFLFRGEPSTSNVEYAVFKTENEIKHLKLDDGSDVWLNRNSILSVPVKFSGDAFQLKLEGEAFFQVAHHPKRVFMIETKNALVQVLGTEFNLKARINEKMHVLSVTDGKVLYSKISSKTEKIVEKGKEAAIDADSELIVLEDIGDENFLSWKTRILKFDEEPFYKVAKQLSEYYQISFTVGDTSLYNLSITTTIVDQPAEKVVKLLEMASDELVITKTAVGYKVNRKK